MLKFFSEKKIDRGFLFGALFFLAVGLIILNSASAAIAYNKHGNTYFFVRDQLTHGILPGLLLFFLATKVKYERWRGWSRYLYGLTIVLLVLVFIPGIGADFGTHAHSWLNLRFFSFQPAELAKFTLVVVLAEMLSRPSLNLTDWSEGLLPVFIRVAPILFLVMLQPDIGTLSIMALTVFLMLVLAGVEGKIIWILFFLGVAAFGLLVLIAPYRLDRLSIFLHPEIEPQGIGYHINAAYLAVGSGGFWGVGYGHSRQKHQYLPEVQADSIFAVYAEEMGFFLSVALVVGFFLLAARGLKIARAAPDSFGRLLAGGVIIWFFAQAALNMAAMVGGSPLTGVPLPLISYGGTAMVCILLAFGVVLSVSKEK